MNNLAYNNFTSNVIYLDEAAEERAVKKQLKKDKEFEKELLANKKKAQLFVRGMCAVLYLVGFLAVVALWTGLYLLCQYLGVTDAEKAAVYAILYCILPLLVTFGFIEKIEGYLKENLFDNIEKNYRRFRLEYYRR